MPPATPSSRNRRGAPQPSAGLWPVATGTAALVPDGDGRRGWTLMVNGVPSSHVDLDDPLRLDFEYMRWMADLLDVLVPAGEPLRVAHLGGAGCTLARYVAATREGSRQIVLEIDPGVLDVARRAFGFRSSSRLRLRVADARQGLADLPQAGQDVVVRDAFAGALVPAHLTTTGFLDAVRRALAPGGVYLANLADSPPLALARGEAATALDRFAEVALIAEPAQFTGRRYGNVVLAASDDDLPLTPLVRRLACGAVRARLLDTAQVRTFASGRRPLLD